MAKLPTYFGYDKGFTTYSSTLYSYDEWRELLKSCIDKNLPVIYTGYSNSGGGHAFVIDGYDDSGRILINFGWNASSNGYYEIGSFGNYVRSNRCWVNVQPEAGGTDVGYLSLSKSGTYTGITYQSGQPRPGSSVSIKFGYIEWNSNGAKFTGRINFKIMSKDGVDKGWAKSTDLTVSSAMSDGSSNCWSSTTLNIPSTVKIERGDYISAYYKENGTTEWKPIRYQASEISIVGKLYCHIADFTSMEFNSQTRKLIFTTFSNATYTLKNSSGSAVSTGVTYSNGVLTIDTNSLTAGKYTVTFTAGTQSTTISFKI